MTIPSRKMYFLDMLWKAKPDVVFLQEVKSIGFELWCRMSHYWKGPYWTSDHSLGSGRVFIPFFFLAELHSWAQFLPLAQMRVGYGLDSR